MSDAAGIRTKRLGRSDLSVSQLSFGGAGIGNLLAPVGDDEAEATVEAAWEAGIRTFDTAPHYGLGLSERRLGDVLRSHPRGQYTLSTKVGRLLEPTPDGVGDDMANGFAVPADHRRVWDFSADGVRRSLDASLERLGLDRVDIVYLHDPDDHPDQALDQAYPALEQLRAEGVVGAIGIGMNQTALPTRFVRETDVDVVLLAGRYTLLDQSALSDLLPEAERRRTAVVVGGVFNSGLLADPRSCPSYDYRPASAEVLQRALRLEEVCEGHGVPLRAAAARFPLGHPAVTGILVGVRSPQQILDAVAQYHRPVPDALWTELRESGLLGGAVPVPGPEGG